MKLIAIMPLNDAKSLQSQLKKENVELVLNHQDQTCNRGCSITVEVHADEGDFPQIAKTLEGNFKDMLDNPDFDIKNLDHTFNPSEETATCPACSFKFATSHKECPDCGLFFG